MSNIFQVVHISVLFERERNGDREREGEGEREGEKREINNFSDPQNKTIPVKGLSDQASSQPALSRGGARREQGKYPLGVHNFM